MTNRSPHSLGRFPPAASLRRPLVGRRRFARSPAVPLALALASVGCAGTTRFLAAPPDAPDSLSPREAAVLEQRELLRQQERVDVVTARLLGALPDAVTGDSTFYVGLRLADPQGLDEEDVLADAVGLAAPIRPFVVGVDPAGPAADSDVLPGDQVLSVADVPVRDIGEVREALGDADPARPVVFRLFRDGRQHELELTGGWRRDGLDVTVVHDDDLVNAFARRRGIVLATGMLRFLRNDHELAVVLGHEIGHVVRGHLSGSYARGRLDARFARDLEREADRFGLELTELAGFNPAAAISLWQRFALDLPRPFSKGWLSTHPPSRERVLSAGRMVLQLRPRQILRAVLPRLPLLPS